MSFETALHLRIESLKSFKEIKQSNPHRRQKKNSLLFYGFLPLLLLMVGVNSGISADKDLGNKKVTTITQANNGNVMEVNNGEVFQIELEELGSAGYQWHMEKVDREYLELVSKETRDQSGGRVGVPVMAIWLLKAKKIGQTGISMDHYRKWEGKEKASEHFSIKLIIK